MVEFLVENGKVLWIYTEIGLTAPGIGGKLNSDEYTALCFAPEGSLFKIQI